MLFPRLPYFYACHSLIYLQANGAEVSAILTIQDKKQRLIVMHLVRVKTLICSILGAGLLTSSLIFPSVFAQDNSDGRYRPEGRAFARTASNLFDDRLFEARTYIAGTDVDEFASATIFIRLLLVLIVRMAWSSCLQCTDKPQRLMIGSES